MNKKLILAAIAVTLSVGSAQAASDITGITPNGNTFNIKPDKFNGDVGYRKYDNFKLDNGDIANLIFERKINGKKEPEHFINLVKNRVNINGIVNSMRDNAFYKGDVIFITPNGLTVGSSGVLNVGQLHVATPNNATFNQLLDDYAAGNLHQRIDKVGNLKKDSNASIDINGRVLSRTGVDLRGTEVTVGGRIINGIKSDVALKSNTHADLLFNNLVNTDGSFRNVVNFEKNGGVILIKSHKDGGMNVSGDITNNGNVYLSNNGSQGQVVSGKLNSNSLVRVYNNKGDLTVGGNALLQAPDVQVVNKQGGNSLTLGNNAKINASRITTVQNEKGALTTGINTKIQAPTVRVLNAATASDATLTGELNADGQMYIINKGDNLLVQGKVNNLNDNGITAINNYKGEVLLNGEINTKGNTAVNNRGERLAVTKNATINNVGNLKLANIGEGGTDIVGNINNEGTLRIYNDAGNLNFATAQSDHSIAPQITNKGDVYIGARKNSTGIFMASPAKISNEGNLYIRNKGSQSTANGMELNGTIENKNGTLAINNDFADMVVAGKISNENGRSGIINRAGGADMRLTQTSTINMNNATANIVNNGSGNMTVNSTINNTSGENYSGRVNVAANSGELLMGAKVHNNAGAFSQDATEGGFYAVVRQNGTGAKFTSSFAVDGNGQILIKNISGQDGIVFNGTINTTDNQAAISNMAGDLIVTGNITTDQAPIIVNNKGNNLIIGRNAQLNSGVEGKIINNGEGETQINSEAQITNMQRHGK